MDLPLQAKSDQRLLEEMLLADLPRQTVQDRRLLLVALASIFFVSGFSALLYQVVWQRLLGLFSGSDVRSVTIVVGAYLAGLGIGSLLGSFIADRLTNRRAVLTFGLCNLGIALFAFASRLIFYDWLFLRLNTLSNSPLVASGIAFASLLIPTTLMGLSLPLLSKALVRNVTGAPKLISILYGINTLGSAVGTLVSGWYLIGILGYERSVYLGGGLSALVALSAIMIARGFDTRRRESHELAPAPVQIGKIPGTVWFWCLLVLISGFAAISLELVWFRLLSVLVEPNAYTFAHLLFFILVGYALGSVIGSAVIDRITNPRVAFLLLQCLAILYTIGIVLVMYRNIGTVIGSVAEARKQITRLDQFFTIGSSYFNSYVLLPSVLLLPPNILIGFSFPVVQKAVQTSGQTVGQRVGLVQVFNIIGNTLGSILTGLVLLDTIGTSGVLRTAGALGLLFAVLLTGNPGGLRRPIMLARGAGVVLAIALVLGVVRFPNTTKLWTRFHGSNEQNALVAEDSTGVAAITVTEGGALLYANGSVQATVPPIGGHGFLGSVSALSHPHPHNVLVVGIGTGGTAYSIGVNQGIKRIKAIEIIGSELPVLKAFAQQDRGVTLRPLFEDPRYKMVIDDGRRELALTNERYDLIEADAIQYWRSHSGMLYSQEFFEQARSRLAEGGIMAQWQATERVARTFERAFPYGVNIGNSLLLGSNTPITFDKDAVLSRFQDPAVIDYLARGGFSAQELHDALGRCSITYWTPETPRQDDYDSDLWPRDEYYLQNITVED